jgi:hypothetical protein
MMTQKSGDSTLPPYMGPAKLHGPVSKTPVLPNLYAILVKPGLLNGPLL